MGYQVPFPMACRAIGLPSPTPEYQFALPRKWAFDWCWPDRMLALEVEGGLYGRGKACPVCHRKAPGAHSSIERMVKDLEKYNEAALLGWRVLRGQPDDLKTGAVFGLLERAFKLESK